MPLLRRITRGKPNPTARGRSRAEKNGDARNRPSSSALLSFAASVPESKKRKRNLIAQWGERSLDKRIIFTQLASVIFFFIRGTHVSEAKPDFDFNTLILYLPMLLSSNIDFSYICCLQER